MGLVNTGIKSTSCEQWNLLLYFWFYGSIFLPEVLDMLFRHMASWILSNTKQIKKKSTIDWLNCWVDRKCIMGHVRIFKPYNNPNTNLKNNNNGSLSTKPSFAMTIPVLWPEPCRKWVRWTEEKHHQHGAVNLRIWSDSGWRNGLWSLVRCSLTSSGIIGANLEPLNWQMEV